MAYSDARKAFSENRTLMKPTANPVLWNISTGLLQLTEALEQDIREIKKRLADIESTVNSR